MHLLVKSWLLFQPFSFTLGDTKLAPRKFDGNGFSRRKLKSTIEILQYFLLFVLLSTIVLTGAVDDPDQSGFISLDCGLPDNGRYVDPGKRLNYNSDAAFIDTGIGKRISSEFISEYVKQFHYVRSFPKGRRNCYKVSFTGGSKYLIRARFMYGNYDGQNKIPKFDVYIGPSKWFTVQLEEVDEIVSKEIIHDVSPRNYIFLCLVDTGLGTPFISALEFRPLNNKTYNAQSGSLMLHTRLDFGSTEAYRYPDDIYDRIWTAPQKQDYWTSIDTSEDIDNQNSMFKQPSIVMQTAIQPTNPDKPLNIILGDQGSAGQFYTYMHFADIQDNQSREFDISLNGKEWSEAVRPSYLNSHCIYDTFPDREEEIIFSLTKTRVSTLPPLINAIEIYYILNLSYSHSNQEDVDAMVNIKSAYKIEKNWQGDPCDAGYLWDGLNCSYSDDDQHRIISLNLSSSKLIGEISPFIYNLSMLQLLDLSNNSLTGSVPDFLSDLTYLKVLNLAGNQLSGPVPAKLIERSNQKSLELSVGENPNLCASLSCKRKKKKNTFVVPIVASFAGVILIIAALVIFWKLRRQKQKVLLASKGDAKTKISLEPQGSRKRSFAYLEIIDITNNFQKLIGKGGFGEVFHGCLDDGTQVAVKLLNPSSNQGYKEFKAEVNHLLRVHHKNLTTLVGFCDDGTNKVLIYEYMANRDLEKHLSGRSTNALSWERRLQIAVDTASGLEYLHNGCKPPIVHRDVKTANILLNDKFQAKLADFGISRSLPFEDDTNTQTVVAGTPGYLDPEYNVKNVLTEKSDVYSFGIVLLRIITGKPVIGKTRNERTHLITWVSAMVAKGDIKNTVDPRLGTDFNINSVWKAVEIAMACASTTSAQRPTMHQVVNELNECIATEIAQTTNETGVKNDSIPFAR